ncbi:MAG: hypothetical protein IJ546_04530 [Prevotella sp.]|nr:hypothetical protein [Prevotella sp.]MBQ9645107.1 hypothetical protein [Prevotella sp.]
MEIKNNKSAWAALATLGVTAVAAGATAFVKIREKRKEQRQAAEQEGTTRLSAEQQMVYNEAIRTFLTLNDRIYELRRHREALQPLISWLATNGEKPEVNNSDDDIKHLADDIERFLIVQVPFINACLNCIGDPQLSYSDYVRGAVGGMFDDILDEEPTGAQVEKGQKIAYVLRLGYCFPESKLAPTPVKAIVLV